ncbi:unnamed protein product, partial [Iphiclides podalirius]
MHTPLSVRHRIGPDTFSRRAVTGRLGLEAYHYEPSCRVSHHTNTTFIPNRVEHTLQHRRSGHVPRSS